MSTAEAWAADIVVCLDAPSLEQLALMKEGATLLSRLDPQNNAELLEACAKRKITALALDAVPRISRAQSLDVRSSLMNVAGYRAVIEAANAFGRQFTGAVTAAGRVNPAKVYVIGVGVAGLAAIGTAGSMGAEAVSYTHLDVYKRQPRHSGCVRPCARRHGSNGSQMCIRDSLYSDEITLASIVSANPDVLAIACHSWLLDAYQHELVCLPIDEAPDEFRQLYLCYCSNIERTETINTFIQITKSLW